MIVALLPYIWNTKCCLKTEIIKLQKGKTLFPLCQIWHKKSNRFLTSATRTSPAAISSHGLPLSYAALLPWAWNSGKFEISIFFYCLAHPLRLFSFLWMALRQLKISVNRIVCFL
jgi:hypothetical protein